MAAKKYSVAGPWDNEPDEWNGEFHGLRVRAVRHHATGSWCGYVLLPRNHPLYGVDYGEIDADAHGGLTYSDYGAGGDNLSLMERSLHDDDVWEVGFDCGHASDYQPVLVGLEHRSIKYRTLEYVKGELDKLASQLKK